MISDVKLLAAIAINAPYLQTPTGIHGAALLAAITWPESSWGGKSRASKYERAYAPGGAYFKAHVVELHHRYGDAASSSWSAWQILYVVAYEMGFTGAPWELVEPGTACPLVVALLNKRCFKWWPEAPTEAIRKGATDIGMIADFYNSGSFRDDRPPVAGYIEKLESAYSEALDYYLSGSPGGSGVGPPVRT